MNIQDHIKDKRLNIIVKPNSPKNKIIGFDKERNAVRIEIDAPPENNKANIEVIKYLSKLTKKEVKIVSGFTSKKKTVSFD